MDYGSLICQYNQLNSISGKGGGSTRSVSWFEIGVSVGYSTPVPWGPYFQYRDTVGVTYTFHLWPKDDHVFGKGRKGSLSGRDLDVKGDGLEEKTHDADIESRF